MPEPLEVDGGAPVGGLPLGGLPLGGLPLGGVPVGGPPAVLLVLTLPFPLDEPVDVDALVEHPVRASASTSNPARATPTNDSLCHVIAITSLMWPVGGGDSLPRRCL